MGIKFIPLSLLLLCTIQLSACVTSVDRKRSSQTIGGDLTTDINKVKAHLPSLYIAGDSTAAKGTGETQTGWAVPFTAYFDPTRVNIVNRARGGRSSRTFVTEGLWGEIATQLKPGDVVLIQFGHNDGGKINDPQRARGSLPGLGEEQQVIDNLQTGQTETVYTFGHYLRRMINDVKAHDAKPVLLSLTLRNIWEGGRIERGSGQYGGWTYQLAWETDTAFYDVTNIVADQFESLGIAGATDMYPQDHTHFNRAGATLHAETIVSGLKGMRPTLVDGWLSEKGQAIKADSNAWLRIPFPQNRELPSIFMVGDSTVRNGAGDGAGGQWGWGDFLKHHFDGTKINVVNRAVGGLSSRTYHTYGHWRRALNMMRPGDVVLIQFGHNDAAALNDSKRARGTIKGIGEQSEKISNLITGEEEEVHTYGWYLKHFIESAKARGVVPVVCSPVPRKHWDGDKIARGDNSYPQWAQQVADQNKAPFIDLHELVAQQYDQLGQKKVEEFFADAHTHTSAAGAELTAKLVVQALRNLANKTIDSALTRADP